VLPQTPQLDLSGPNSKSRGEEEKEEGKGEEGRGGGRKGVATAIEVYNYGKFENLSTVG